MTLCCLRSDHEQAAFHVAALKVEFSSVVAAVLLHTNHKDIIQSLGRSAHSFVHGISEAHGTLKVDSRLRLPLHRKPLSSPVQSSYWFTILSSDGVSSHMS